MRIRKVKWEPEAATRATGRGTAEGARLSAERLLELAGPATPYAQGDLRDSAYVDDDGEGSATVGYDSEYAVRLHENPDYNFRGQGEGKWLEHAMQESKREVLEIMGDELRKALT